MDRHKHLQYTLRIPEDLIDKLKYIAEYNARSANREIELLVRRHIAAFEKENGVIELTPEDYAFIHKRSGSRKEEGAESTPSGLPKE